MRKVIQNNKIVFVSILVALTFWLLESGLHYFLFDHGHGFELWPHDANELWMRIVIVVLVVLVGFYADKQLKSQQRINDEKMKTLKATMHTVEDIVGNALNELLYFYQLAKDNEAFDQQVVEEYRRTIHGIAEKLRAVTHLQELREKEVFQGIYELDLGEQTTTSDQVTSGAGDQHHD